MSTTPRDQDIAACMAKLVRHDAGRLLSVLIGHLGDFQLAEDSLQDAVESALIHWNRNGLPRAPTAWLLQVARRKAIDRLRRAAVFRDKARQLSLLIDLEDSDPAPESDDPIGDERLKLIFTCCHPALDRTTSLALTLRSVCGLTTEEIARAFVTTRDAMAQRLVRARHKIARAAIPYAVPGPDGWAGRLDRVLGVIYLIHNEGYASAGEDLVRHDLSDEALRLCTLLLSLCPDEPEVAGLLALLNLHKTRRMTRLTPDGDIVTLEDQDRALWDHEAIRAATTGLEAALRRQRPGPYQLQAAIAAVHAEAPSFAETRWPEIVLLYDLLLDHQPNPVARLNRLVALSHIDDPRLILPQLDALSETLAAYQPFHAARAHLLARTGDSEQARLAYATAMDLSSSRAEKAFLAAKMRALA